MPQTFGGQVLRDPRRVKLARSRLRRDQFPQLELANCLMVPSGRCAAQGWLLLKKADYQQIDAYSTALVLKIDDFVNGGLTFNNLAVVQARCVSAGQDAPDSIYLVQVTDGRGVVSSPWFDFPINAQYNVRAPAYPEQYYSGSLNAGLAWTWATMTADIWNRMSAFLGTFPGLPTTPSDAPEGFIFPGVSCWEALQQVLDVLGMTVAVDLTKASGQYSIIVGGSADAVFTAKETLYLPSVEDDFYWIDTGSGRVPAFVTVYFHRRNQYYGTEESVRKDSFQWSTTPAYSVTLAAPATFSSAKGTGFVWDDFTVRYDVDGVPLAADVAAAATIAQEQVTQYFERIYRGTQGYMRRVYTGALPFATGSLVDGVKWYQNYKLGSADEQRSGWRTELCRGYVWQEVVEPYTSELSHP